jgi:hypothetical protein
VSGTTFTYLPDGQGIYLPQDTPFSVAGNRMPARVITNALGQIGVWYAAAAQFQGLQTVSATVTTALWTSLSLQTEMIDGYNMHSTSTNAANVIPPFSGSQFYYNTDDYYLYIGYVPFNNAAANGPPHIFLAGINNQPMDSTIYEGMKIAGATGHSVTSMVVDIIGNKSIGDDSRFVQLAAFQTSGGSIGTTVSSKVPSLTARWCGVNRVWSPTTSPSATPHTMIPEDQLTGNTTGASPVSPGVKVPYEYEVWDKFVFYYSPPMCRAETNSGTLVSSATFSAITFSGANLNLWGSWSGTNPTRMTAVRDGFYLVYGLFGLQEAASGNTGYRACAIRVNGNNSLLYGGNTMVPPTADTTSSATAVVALIQLTTGDYVELMVAQTQGVTRTITVNGGDGTRFLMLWMGL